MPLTHYFDNTGGLNITDSPFYAKDTQATGGYNFDYLKTGAISKILGRSTINAVADSQLRTLGVFVKFGSDGTKVLVRAGGTKIQSVDLDVGTFTNLASDAATPTTDFYASGTTTPVSGINFNTPAAEVLWLQGGDSTSLLGFNGTNVTENGVPAPTGSFTTSVGGSGGDWDATGSYFYALAVRKASTQTISNTALDVEAIIASTTQKVTLTFPTGLDTTKFDEWVIYRSELSGGEFFTTGTLVAQVPSTDLTYLDDGATAIATAQVLPRADSPTDDHSVLPTATITGMAAFKRRMVAAQGSTIFVSLLDGPEYWPTDLRITLPYGGPIKALGIVGSEAELTGQSDEYLAIFQEGHMWMIAGTFIYSSSSGLYDFELRFVDSIGCSGQSVVVNANGFVAWVDFRGVYVWDGTGKPIYVSRLIEAWFDTDGDLDRTKFGLGFGAVFRKKNQIIWNLSHRTLGENSIQLKLDLRLTVPKFQKGLSQTIMEGTFLTDSIPSLYGGSSFLPTTNNEQFIAGDNAGFLYKLYVSPSDPSGGIDFNYLTKDLLQDAPATDKRYKKVLAYVDQLDSVDITLNYWTSYKRGSTESSQVMANAGKVQGQPAALWDLAIWDQSLWDEYFPRTKMVVFNLHAKENNVEGEAIRLEFVQSESNSPVVIHGFSILWEDKGLIK